MKKIVLKAVSIVLIQAFLFYNIGFALDGRGLSIPAARTLVGECQDRELHLAAPVLSDPDIIAPEPDGNDTAIIEDSSAFARRASVLERFARGFIKNFLMEHYPSGVLPKAVEIFDAVCDSLDRDDSLYATDPNLHQFREYITNWENFERCFTTVARELPSAYEFKEDRQTFINAARRYIRNNPVDPYSPITGTPHSKLTMARFITDDVTREYGIEISSHDVMVSVGTTGLLTLLIRIFCDVENAAVRDENELDLIALSENARPLYKPSSFARVRDAALGTKETPKVKIIDSLDIELGGLNDLLDTAEKEGTILIFLDNGTEREKVGKIYELLKERASYRKNVVIIKDVSRRLGLPLYDLAGVVTFNKAIRRVFEVAASGTIAAPSTNTQAGFEALISESYNTGDLAFGENLETIEPVDEAEGIINRTHIAMTPDLTVFASPFGMLDENGKTPVIINDAAHSHIRTLVEVFKHRGKTTILPRDIIEIQNGNLQRRKGSYGFQEAFSKAVSFGILAKVQAADEKYTEELLADGSLEREELEKKLILEPNPGIVKILHDAWNRHTLNQEEIILFMAIFNIIKMHVGVPGYPRDEFVLSSVMPKKACITKEEFEELKEKCREASAYFAANVYGLDGIGVTNPTYGSKVAIGDLLNTLSYKAGKPIEIAVPRPYYVGYDSTIKTAGITNINYFHTKTSANWTPSEEEVACAFSPGKDTGKVLLLTMPDNPSGTVMPEESVKGLLKYAVYNDIFVILDGAYGRLVLNGETPVNLGRIIKEISEETHLPPETVRNSFAVIFTQSKEIVHPGTRLGAVFCYDDSIISFMNNNITLEADPIAMKAQIESYGPENAEKAKAYVEKHADALTKNRDYICDTFDELGINYVKPKGAFYVLFRIGKGGYIRFSFAGPHSEIIKVAARLKMHYEILKDISQTRNVTAMELFNYLGITSLDGVHFGAFESVEEEAAYEAVGAEKVEESVESPAAVNDDFLLTPSEEEADEQIATIEELEAACLIAQEYIIKMIDKAGSGHPGGSLSSIAFLTALRLSGLMRTDPRYPKWANRDIYVSSKGHIAPADYAALTQRGFFPVDELNHLREIYSRLSGHPDMLKTLGIDLTTGPLGNGAAGCVGMAIAAKMNGRDYHVNATLGDGELQEGIVAEIIELAGKMMLDNLTFFVDVNDMEIDGETGDVTKRNYKKFFESHGWNVIELGDKNTPEGENMAKVVEAYKAARRYKGKPTVILAHTRKGLGLPGQDSHGAPAKVEKRDAALKIIGENLEQRLKGLGYETREAFMDALRTKLDKKIDYTKPSIDAENKTRVDEVIRKKMKRAKAAREKLVSPDTYAIGKNVATRTGNADAASFTSAYNLNTVFLSADLTGSTQVSKVADLFGFFDVEENSAENKDLLGRILRVGIKEQGMTGVAIGLALCGQIPFTATYGKFTLRQADQINHALLTGLGLAVGAFHAGTLTGPDGPTHEDVDSAGVFAQLLCGIYEGIDAQEQWILTTLLFHNMLRKGGVHIPRLARPATPVIDKPEGWEEGARKGFYKIFDGSHGERPDIAIITTGPIGEKVIFAAKKLVLRGKKVIVIDVTRLRELVAEGKIDEFAALIKDAEYVLTVADMYPHILEDKVNAVIAGRLLKSKEPSRIKRVIPLGVQDRGKSAKESELHILHNEYNIDADGIVATALMLLEEEELLTLPDRVLKRYAVTPGNPLKLQFTPHHFASHGSTVRPRIHVKGDNIMLRDIETNETTTIPPEGVHYVGFRACEINVPRGEATVTVEYPRVRLDENKRRGILSIYADIAEKNIHEILASEDSYTVYELIKGKYYRIRHEKKKATIDITRRGRSWHLRLLEGPIEFGLAIPGAEITEGLLNLLSDADARETMQKAIIGVPEEIKAQAERVGLTPAGVRFLTQFGIKVLVQRGAGKMHFTDEKYYEAGAELCDTAEEVWNMATIIKKVKEPLKSEYKYLREGLIVFTYFHLAHPELKGLAEQLLTKKVTGIAYESVPIQDKAGRIILPMLKAMSIVAGNRGGYFSVPFTTEVRIVGEGAERRAELTEMGKAMMAKIKAEYPVVSQFEGKLAGKKAVVLGGGVSGEEAARALLRCGAEVTITDIRQERLDELREIFKEYGGKLTLLKASKDINAPEPELLQKYKEADILQGCILLESQKAPQMSRELLAEISSDRCKFICDIAVDQGGNFYKRMTTHADPVYVDDFGNIIYGVANIPDNVGGVASVALEKTNIAHAAALASGLERATEASPELLAGTNVIDGKVVNKGVTEAYPDLPAQNQEWLKRRILLDASHKALPKEWTGSEIQFKAILKALRKVGCQDIRKVGSHTAFIFSEQITFEYDLGPWLPKIAAAGIPIAVITPDSKRAEVINELNEVAGLLNDRKILVFNNVETAAEEMNRYLASIRDGRGVAKFYYFQNVGENYQTQNRAITVVSIMAEKIKQALREAVHVSSEFLRQFERAEALFRQAA
ncbi:MAG: aminotransferase class I/II-fold pyridoxal phosphate-dependent enzyme [Candidatus Omnitrophica bacterium]|nr:aminotransferase class I/II-fold pyridoxal phosphate-dependent enzyme [Candidatus Omnitrophota bacterium]